MDKELKAMVHELHNIAQAFIGISETLEVICKAETATAEPPQTAEPQSKESPKPKPLTQADVRAVLAEKSQAGFTDEVRALISKYGVSKVSEIKADDYATVIAEAKKIGEVQGNG